MVGVVIIPRHHQPKLDSHRLAYHVLHRCLSTVIITLLFIIFSSNEINNEDVPFCYLMLKLNNSLQTLTVVDC